MVIVQECFLLLVYPLFPFIDFYYSFFHPSFFYQKDIWWDHDTHYVSRFLALVFGSIWSLRKFHSICQYHPAWWNFRSDPRYISQNEETLKSNRFWFLITTVETYVISLVRRQKLRLLLCNLVDLNAFEPKMKFLYFYLSFFPSIFFAFRNNANFLYSVLAWRPWFS